MNSSHSQSSRQALDGTFWSLLSEGLLLPVGLLILIFLTRLLGPEEYGIYSITAALIVWCETTIMLIFSQATIKFVSASKDWRPVGTSALRIYLVAGTIVALILSLSAPGIANILNEPRMSAYIRLFALDIPLFSLAQAHIQFLIGTGQYRKRALVTTINWFCRLVLILTLVNIGFSIPGAIVGWVTATFIYLCMGHYFIRPSFINSSDFSVRNLLTYALPLFFSGISLRIYELIDIFALKALGGTDADIGYYSLAQKLAIIPRIFIIAFSPILLSTLTRLLSQGNENEAKKLGTNSMRLIFWQLPFAILVISVTPELIPLVFGSDYLPAIPLFKYLIFGILGLMMLSNVSTMLISLGKPHWILYLNVPLLPLAILGHMWLIPIKGSLGAATITSSLGVLVGLSGILMVYQFLKIYPPISTLWKCLFISAFVYAGGNLWSTPGHLIWLKLSLISIGIVLAFLILKEFNKDELALVRSLITKKMKASNNTNKI